MTVDHGLDEKPGDKTRGSRHSPDPKVERHQGLWSFGCVLGSIGGGGQNRAAGLRVMSPRTVLLRGASVSV